MRRQAKLDRSKTNLPLEVGQALVAVRKFMPSVAPKRNVL
jgi:hypothetical protein